MKRRTWTCLTAALALLVAAGAARGAGVTARGFEVKGKVVDQAEKPISAATVWCVWNHEVRKAQTNASGAFVFGNMEVGLVSLVVRKDGYSLGGRTGPLAEPRSLTIRLVEPAVLGLRIIDPAYQPVPGARIKQMTINDEFVVPVEDLVGQGFPAIRSGDDGRLEIRDLPKGGYVGFRVSHQDYADTIIPYLPADQSKQSIQLYPGETLRGRVTSENGSGVGGAYVSLFRLDENVLRVFAETVSDPEGYYSLVARRGTYLVGAKHRDFASPLPRRVELGSGGTPRSAQANGAFAPPATGDGETVADLTLPSPCFVEGSVLGPTAKPATGVWVGYVLGQGVYEETLTTTDGTFRLKVAAVASAVAAVASAVAAFPSDGARAIDGDVTIIPPSGLMTDGPDRVAVKWGKEQTVRVGPFRLKPLPEIDGTVVGPDDAGQGTAPQPNVLISSLNLSPPVWAITDEKGMFRVQLSKVPPDGKARFRVEHGLRFLRSDFDVELAALNSVQTKLEPFEPQTTSPKQEGFGNDLADLVGKEAPEIACDTWFNLATDIALVARDIAPSLPGSDKAEASLRLTLKDLRGKVVVLTFWNGVDAFGAVRDRIEEMRALHDLFRFCQATNVSATDAPRQDARGTDVVIIGIHDSMGSPQAVDQYVKNYRITFPVGRDTGTFETFQRYKVRTIPETVLIDRKGILRYYAVPGRHLELIKDLRRSP